jgi:serine/threonine-protein kinase
MPSARPSGGGVKSGALPRTFGKYTLLERIGSGGMADAYRARMPGIAGFEKTLVVKRLHAHLAAEPKFAQMFIDEARIAARLDHPNVVAVFELGEVPGEGLYIAMDHVAGTNLHVLLQQAVERRLELPLWFCLHVVDQLLSGLGAAHTLVDEEGEPLGVVHRDVTPSNVFLSFFGDVKLGDFGVASSRLRLGHTELGELRGKLGYMAPEQLRGRGVDARTDLFAVGVILWELLAARRLFGQTTPYEVMAAVIEGERVPPSRHRAGLSGALDALVLRALAIEPDARWPSASAMQAALDPIRAAVGTTVRRQDVREAIEVVLGRRSADGPGAKAHAGALGPRTADLPPRVSMAEAVARPSLELVVDVDDAALPLPRTRDLQIVPGTPDDDEEQHSAPLPIVVGSTQDLEFADEATPVLTIDPRGGVDALAEGLAALEGIADLVLGEPDADAPPFPLYYRDAHKGPWGPVSWEQLAHHLRFLHDLPHAQAALGVAPDALFPLEVFATLTGQEALKLEPPSLPGATGSLRTRTLASILCTLGALGADGRLYVVGESPVHPPLREIDFVDGHITYVATDAAGLQLPELLIRYGLVGEERVAELMWAVVAERRDVEAIVSRALAVDLREHFAHFHRERLGEVFSWRHGTYAFDAAVAPTRRAPIGPSTLAVVLDAVLRSTAPEELDHTLAPWRGRRIVAGEHAAALLRDVPLTEAQQQGLRRALSEVPIELVLRQTPERREVASLLYVLGQAGLLRAA